MKKVWKNICAFLATPSFVMDKDDHTINMLEEHMDKIEEKIEADRVVIGALQGEKAALEAAKTTLESEKSASKTALDAEKAKVTDLEGKLTSEKTVKDTLAVENADLKAKLALRTDGPDSPGGPNAPSTDPKVAFQVKASKLEHNKDADEALRKAGHKITTS